MPQVKSKKARSSPLTAAAKILCKPPSMGTTRRQNTFTLSAQIAQVTPHIKIMEDLTAARPNQPLVTGVRKIPARVITVTADRHEDWNPSIWSFLCLLVGIVLLIVPPGLILISALLFLGSFILSIVALEKHHLASGMIMMILLCTAPPFFIVRAFAVAMQKSEENQRAPNTYRR
jgi:hypothetical protein